jgi:hypothetical protein
LLDFGQHRINVARRRFVARGGPDGLKFLAYIPYGLTAAGVGQGLADPFGDGHLSRACPALNLPVLGSWRMTWSRLAML